MAAIDFDHARIYAIPMAARFRGITRREGMLIQGPAGWGEFCPFADYDDQVSASWLATAIEQCTVGWAQPMRDRIPINCTVPGVGPDLARKITAESGCRTAKVKVADHPESLSDDLARIEAVRDALGPDGYIRIDANGAWDIDTAISRIRQLDKAAGGLEYVEQPCATIDELAAVRRRVDVKIAADESIRHAEDPMRVAVAGAADIAVIKCTPLGGVRRSLQVAEAAGLPCVISSALETSVGLSAQLALAGALPELNYACGLGTLALLKGDVVADNRSLRPVDGYLPVLRHRRLGRSVPDRRLRRVDVIVGMHRRAELLGGQGGANTRPRAPRPIHPHQRSTSHLVARPTEPRPNATQLSSPTV